MNLTRHNLAALVFLILSIILFPSVVFGFGVSSPVVDFGEIDADPGMQPLIGELAVIRSASEKDTVRFIPELQGEGSEYLHLPQALVINRDDRLTEFSIELRPEYQLPGDYEVILELYIDNGGNRERLETGITVPITWTIIPDDRKVTYSIHQVAVVYADSEQEQLDSFRSLITNTGEIDWKPEKVSFSILDAEGSEEIIHVIESESIEYIHPGETVKYSASVSDVYVSTLEAGLYTVRTYVTAEQEVKESSSRFFIPLEETVEDVIDESLLTKLFLKGDKSIITPTWQIVFFGALAIIITTTLLLLYQQQKKTITKKKKNTVDSTIELGDTSDIQDDNTTDETTNGSAE